MAPPVIAEIGLRRDPRIDERVDHQRRDGDAVEKALGGVALVIILGAGEAVARRAEAVVEFPDAARVDDGGALAGRDLVSGTATFYTHVAQQLQLHKSI